MHAVLQDEPMENCNKALMIFASYKAGPGRLRQLRHETETRSLDPNMWFNNVERVASERIGGETVTSVSAIDEYYLTYGLLSAERDRRDAPEGGGGDAHVNTETTSPL